MQQRPLLYLTTAEVKHLLTPADIVAIAERTMLAHARGEVVMAEPRQIAMRPSEWTFKYKAVALPALGATGVRLVALNRVAGKPPGTGPTQFVVISDVERGETLAFVEEEWSYAIRTGAQVAVAARLLARPGGALALIGAGAMARGTLTALLAVYQPSAVRVASRSAASRERFAREMAAEAGVPITPTADVAEALQGAAVAVCTTTATEPFIYWDWIAPGCLVYSMGEHQELETRAYTECGQLIFDDWKQCQLKSDIRRLLAEGILHVDAPYASLYEILAGSRPGRRTAAERILVRSQGLASLDTAVAHAAYVAAVAAGVGQRLDPSGIHHWR